MNELEDFQRRNYLFNKWCLDETRNTTAHDDALRFWQHCIEEKALSNHKLVTSTSDLQKQFKHQSSGETPSSTMIEHLWNQLCGVAITNANEQYASTNETPIVTIPKNVLKLKAENETKLAVAAGAKRNASWGAWAADVTVDATKSLTSMMWNVSKAGAKLVLSGASSSSPRSSPRQRLKSSVAQQLPLHRLQTTQEQVSQASEFVVLTAAHQRADELMRALNGNRRASSGAHLSPVQRLLTWQEVREAVPRDELSDDDLDVVLALLAVERRLARVELSNGACGYLIVGANKPYEVAEEDVSVVALKYAQHNLIEQQQKALDEANVCAKEALKLSKTDRSLALRQIGRRKKLLQVAQQRASALDNVRAVIEGIDEAHSTQQVHDALQMGASALRSANARSAPREEIDETLCDIQELLDDQTQLLEDIGAVSVANNIDSEAEEELLRELDELELEVNNGNKNDNKTPVSVGTQPNTVTSPPTAVSATTSPTSADLQARLEALTMTDASSKSSSPLSASSTSTTKKQLQFA